MQYVRNLSDSVSTAWNSINPATLSGAIDVMVVEREDGTLVCSPFHVRFGKFSLLRPYEKKVEFRVNGVKQDYSMKLGEGGEAFFVFETTDTIPASLQTSPLSSPASSPPLGPEGSEAAGLQEDPLSLDQDTKSMQPEIDGDPAFALQKNGLLTPLSSSPNYSHNEDARRPWSGDFSAATNINDELQLAESRLGAAEEEGRESPIQTARSASPPQPSPEDAASRAVALSNELSAVNIPNHVNDRGDLMLDLSAFQGNEEDVFRAEILARKILSEELDGNYDIGALIGVDEKGNLWIYSSEEAKEEAMKKTTALAMRPGSAISADAASDPGYQSDGSDGTATGMPPLHRRSESDVGPMQPHSPPITPPGSTTAGNPNKNYAKTLRLTSDQLKALNLKPGENSMSFTVNRATCQAYMFLWKQETPVVISDIDGTITKSDALGHVLNMIGRDWTHVGVAKLYSDIVANGYNIMYLTSRSVGQADTTRAYLANIVQDGCRLPRGPTILSPDRTMAALRREIYLRKPHIFKMATLRDIRQLFGPDHKAFYAGFGNRFTDQISYRTVDVPRTRIFTINSNAEVSLDLLSLNKLKMSYMNINEVVDHYFPPVSTLVQGCGEDFTDFKYWREPLLDLDDFTASESDGDERSEYAEEGEGEEEEEEEEAGQNLADSFMGHEAEAELGSEASGEIEEDMAGSMMDDYDDADDEDGFEEYGDEEAEREEIADEVSASEGLSKEEARRLVKDHQAELITGVKHLSLKEAQ